MRLRDLKIGDSFLIETGALCGREFTVRSIAPYVLEDRRSSSEIVTLNAMWVTYIEECGIKLVNKTRGTYVRRYIQIKTRRQVLP